MKPTQTKNQAFELLEATRAKLIAQARRVARELGSKQTYVTIDDVRDYVELPEGVNGVVFGVIFKDKSEWEYTKDIPSRRKTSHGRKIQVYRYIGTKVSFPVTETGQLAFL